MCCEWSFLTRVFIPWEILKRHFSISSILNQNKFEKKPNISSCTGNVFSDTSIKYKATVGCKKQGTSLKKNNQSSTVKCQTRLSAFVLFLHTTGAPVKERANSKEAEKQIREC